MTRCCSKEHEHDTDKQARRCEALCEHESAEAGTLLCVLPMGHDGPHDTPHYGEAAQA